MVGKPFGSGHFATIFWIPFLSFGVFVSVLEKNVQTRKVVSRGQPRRWHKKSPRTLDHAAKMKER